MFIRMPDNVSPLSHSRSLVRRFSVWLMLVCFVMSTTGCSMMNSGQQRITVISDPQGAMVQVNGSMVGRTPVTAEINRKETAVVMVRKDGYYPATRTTNRRLSMTGVLDILGGLMFLVPFIGLASDGAWEQDPAVMSFMLVEEEEEREDAHERSRRSER